MDGSGFEVAPGIHRIEARLGDRYVACYLVVGDDDALLVDTGVDATPVGSILPYLDGIGLGRDRLRWVVVTHADVDHMGGNAALKAAVPGAALVADKMDLDLVEDVDRIVAERYSEFAADHGIDIDNGFKAWCHDVARAIPIDLVMHGTIELQLGGRIPRDLPDAGSFARQRLRLGRHDSDSDHRRRGSGSDPADRRRPPCLPADIPGRRAVSEDDRRDRPAAAVLAVDQPLPRHGRERRCGLSRRKP